MRKYIIIFTNLLLSCSIGVWDENRYRPIEEDFELKGKKNTENQLLEYNVLYITSIPEYSSDGEKIRGSYLFYEDGRVIFNTIINDNLEEVIKKSSWENASFIGYYIIEDDKLKIERFLPYEGGRYSIDYALITKGKILLGRPKLFKLSYEVEYHKSDIYINE